MIRVECPFTAGILFAFHIHFHIHFIYDHYVRPPFYLDELGIVDTFWFAAPVGTSDTRIYGKPFL